jgi:NAD(P)H dehydrogenase (quinone)
VSAARVLVLYYSRTGCVAELARHVARGVEAAGARAVVRTVAPLGSGAEATRKTHEQGPPFAEPADLRNCDALLLGSPTRFGNMAAPLKHFIEQTSDIWLSGGLAGKPAGVFTSSTSAHGGQESTLLTMVLPLVHHGMVWVGVPYTVRELFSTRRGGGPYGASHVEGDDGDYTQTPALDENELRIARALGSRVARIATHLTTLEDADEQP